MDRSGRNAAAIASRISVVAPAASPAPWRAANEGRFPSAEDPAIARVSWSGIPQLASTARRNQSFSAPPWLANAAAHSAKPLRGYDGSCISLLKIANVLRQVLDVLIGKIRGVARHVRGIVGAPPGLEVEELLLHVLRPLPRDPRNLVLADEAAEMAHRAERCVGGLAAGFDLGPIDREADRLGFLRGVIIAQRHHVVLRQARGHRRHLRIAAAPFLEVFELEVDIAPALAGKDRIIGIGRIAIGTMTRSADLCLVARGGKLRGIGLR